jgi:hypothetical protein
MCFPDFFVLKKTSECVFQIFSKFELENFGKHVPKLLYKSKNRKMDTQGVGREKILSCISLVAQLHHVVFSRVGREENRNRPAACLIYKKFNPRPPNYTHTPSQNINFPKTLHSIVLKLFFLPKLHTPNNIPNYQSFR